MPATSLPKHPRRHHRHSPIHFEFLESRLLLSAINTANAAWSTYLGGVNDDGLVGPAALVIDSQNRKIIGGWSESPDLPNANNANPNYTVDAYVAQYDSHGSLLWSTFLGGTDDDTDGIGVALDSSDNIFLTGFVTATDLDAALNTPLGSRDAFLAKFNSSGMLLWSLYLGGSADDSGRSVTVDSSGNAYVTGYTYSANLETPDGPAHGQYHGGKDAFVAKVDPDGNLLSQWYFGGAGDDDPGRIALASDGSVLLAGTTTSTDLDATNSFHGGASDAFVVRFDADHNTQWATYLGGSGAESVSGGNAILSTGLALDSHDNAVIAGYTESRDFPRASNRYSGNGDGFVCQVNSSGSLQWSLYLGGRSADAAIDVAIDPAGNIITSGLIGFTSLTGTSMNALVAKVSPNGTLDWLRQFGGSRNDFSASLALDSAANLWFAGSTWSTDLPAADNAAPGGNLVVDPKPGSPYDAFLARIDAAELSRPDRLVISTLPTTITAGTLPTLQVQLQFATGNLVLEADSSVTLSLLSSTGASLGGTTSVPVIDGIATFTNLSLTTTGTYTLVATDASLSTRTARFIITPDLATGHLVLAQSPTDTVVGHRLAPNLILKAVDQFGNLIPTDHSQILLTTDTGAFTGTALRTLSHGTATFSNLIFQTAGTYTLTATPATSSTLAITTPVSFVQHILPATTNTIATPSVKAAGYTFGSTIYLTTRLTSNAPGNIPFTGSPTLLINATTSIPATSLASNGTAKFTLPLLTVGSYTLQIQYPGDTNHLASTTAPFTVTINPTRTTTSLATSPSNPVFGQTLTLTAAVKSANAPAYPRTGTIQFYDNGDLLQSVTLDNNSASLSLVPSSTGNHYYQALYLGDTNFLPRTSSTLRRTVSKAHTSLTLTPSASAPSVYTSLLHNQTLSLDIQVSVLAPGNTPLTNALVLLKDNGKPLGTLTLDSSGHASLPSLSYPTPGTHTLQAIFLGDSFATATSSTLKLTIT